MNSAKNSQEPQHNENNQDQAEHASEAGGAVAVVAIVAATAAQQQNQDDDDKDRTHSPPIRLCSVSETVRCICCTRPRYYFFTASLIASLTPPTAFWILPSTWSDSPSDCSLTSPTALPTVSLMDPFTCFADPAIRSLSIVTSKVSAKRHPACSAGGFRRSGDSARAAPL